RGAVLEAGPPGAGRGERHRDHEPGASHRAGASVPMYERIRAVLTPMSPLPSRDLERMSTRAPPPSGRTRITTSSWKRKSLLIATASSVIPFASSLVTVQAGIAFACARAFAYASP